MTDHVSCCPICVKLLLFDCPRSGESGGLIFIDIRVAGELTKFSAMTESVWNDMPSVVCCGIVLATGSEESQASIYLLPGLSDRNEKQMTASAKTPAFEWCHFHYNPRTPHCCQELVQNTSNKSSARDVTLIDVAKST